MSEPRSGVPTLRSLLDGAVTGRFPAVDGGWTRIAPWRRDVGAIVAFTGHAFVALPHGHTAGLERLGLDGYGGAHAPSVVSALAGPGGWIDSLDVVLVRRAPEHPGPSVPLVERPDLADHHRVELARRVRDDVVALGFPDPSERSVVTLSRGLGGLPEIGIETDGGLDAVAMIQSATAFATPGATIVAAVAPGNARALRTFLTAGYRPVASIQLFQVGGVDEDLVQPPLLRHDEAWQPRA